MRFKTSELGTNSLRWFASVVFSVIFALVILVAVSLITANGVDLIDRQFS